MPSAARTSTGLEASGATGGRGERSFGDLGVLSELVSQTNDCAFRTGKNSGEPPRSGDSTKRKQKIVAKLVVISENARKILPKNAL